MPKNQKHTTEELPLGIVYVVLDLDLAMALDTEPGTLPKRQSTRTCLVCQREYTCWASPDELDGFCSEKCEKALDELYSQNEKVS